MKAKPGCSYDKRLYCDIFSLYYKCEKEWDMGDLKDKIEWWCYATDLERYIKQLQKDLGIATKALEEIDTTRCIPQQTLISLGKFSKTTRFNAGNIICVATPDYIHNTLEQIEHKE